MEGELVGYDPTVAVRRAVDAVAELAKDVAAGNTRWDRPADAANSLEQMDRLTAALADLLRRQAEALPQLTADPQAAETAKQVSEAAGSATKLGEQIHKAWNAARAVR